MKLFVTDDEVFELEQQLIQSTHFNKLIIEIELAWHLRQKNPERAQELISQNLTQLSLYAKNNSLHADKELVSIQKNFQARINLLQSEVLWFSVRPNEAIPLANQALAEFEELQNWGGCADVHWLLSWVAMDAGDVSRQRHELNLMIDKARLIDDKMRVNIARIVEKRLNLVQDKNLITPSDIDYLNQIMVDDDAIVLAWCNEFLALFAYKNNDFSEALSLLKLAYEQAISSGQHYFSFLIANKVATLFKLLNDYQSSLDWTQITLDLSQQLNTVRCIALCEISLSENLRYIKKFQLAKQHLEETFVHLEQIKQSHVYLKACNLSAKLALDLHDYLTALTQFKQLETLAIARGCLSFQTEALIGASIALKNLNQIDEALTTAKSAKKWIVKNHPREIDLYITIYELFLRLPAQISWRDEAIEEAKSDLFQSLESAKKIPQYVFKSYFYELMADSLQRNKAFKSANYYVQQAIVAKSVELDKKTLSRINSMKLTHQIDYIKKESTLLRQQAQIESDRAENFLKMSMTLEKLGEIGRVITTHLKQEEIFKQLNFYIHSMLPIDGFSIFLIDATRQFLILKYSTHQAASSEQLLLNINDLTHLACLSFTHQKELHNFQHDNQAEIKNSLQAEEISLFVPLSIGTDSLGVMAIYTRKRTAFDQNEILIFKSLCSYAAIGFAHIRSCDELEINRKKLVDQEKIAALNSLVAAVAHQLNTPIGNALLLTTSLAETTTIFESKLNNNQMRRSDLSEFIAATKDASHIIARSLQTTEDLIQCFEQLSIDPSKVQTNEFEIKSCIDTIVDMLRPQFAQKRIALHTDIHAGVVLNSYQEPLQQVIMNCMQNVLIHAFDDRASGNVSITTSLQKANRIQIEISDDGCGIKPEYISKVFDPFFTTKLGFGGSGLGLYVNYNIVKSIFGGIILVESKVDAGTTFTIDIPLSY